MNKNTDLRFARRPITSGLAADASYPQNRTNLIPTNQKQHIQGGYSGEYRARAKRIKPYRLLPTTPLIECRIFKEKIFPQPTADLRKELITVRNWNRSLQLWLLFAKVRHTNKLAGAHRICTGSAELRAPAVVKCADYIVASGRRTRLKATTGPRRIFQRRLPAQIAAKSC